MLTESGTMMPTNNCKPEAEEPPNKLGSKSYQYVEVSQTTLLDQHQQRESLNLKIGTNSTIKSISVMQLVDHKRSSRFLMHTSLESQAKRPMRSLCTMKNKEHTSLEIQTRSTYAKKKAHVIREPSLEPIC